MSRKVPVQSLPHSGVRDGFKREGKVCTAGPIRREFSSISKAKRFMRTGSEHR